MSNPLDTQVGGGHYKTMKIQHVEFVHANGIPYIEANAIKYICRHRSKNGRQDILKAIHYLQILLELEYPAPFEPNQRVMPVPK
jgi:hypothetical protein